MTSYLDAYEQVCQALEICLQKRLGRSLDGDERLGLWNAGSLMMLESVERALGLIADPTLLAQELRTMTALFHPNLERYRQKALHHRAAQGTLTPAIQIAIDTAPTVYAVLRLLD